MTKKRVFLDKNVFLDLALGRAPHDKRAREIFQLAIHREIVCGTAPNAYVIAFFYLRKEVYPDQMTTMDIKHRLTLLHQTIRCPDLGDAEIASSLAMEEPEDLEDDSVIALARKFDADVLVTRDQKLLSSKVFPMQTPFEFLNGFYS